MKFTAEQQEYLERNIDMEGLDITKIGTSVGIVHGDVDSVFGNVRRDVKGAVWGNVGGNVLGDVKRNVHGNVGGTVYGDVCGYVEGNIWGDVSGDVFGDVRGTVYNGDTI